MAVEAPAARRRLNYVAGIWGIGIGINGSKQGETQSMSSLKLTREGSRLIDVLPVNPGPLQEINLSADRDATAEIVRGQRGYSR